MPKDLEDWRTYVRTVATRYKGRIHEYEIWNEPDEKFFYTGTVPQLVEMARIAYTTLKEVDPTNLVSSPPFTLLGGVKWLDQYLQAGGGKYADVIGFHFYVAPNPPEAMIDLVQQVKAVMEKNGISDKQLWNTESGWAMANHLNQVQVGNSGMGRVLTVPEAVGYVARANILLWAAGVSRFFYYSWDNKIMGLTEEDGKTIKEPASAYAEVEKWLIDAVMLSCGKSADGTWTSEITRDGGYRGWILWNPDRSLEFRVPAEWHILSVRELLGGAKKLSPDQKIQINQTPILLENTVR